MFAPHDTTPTLWLTLYAPRTHLRQFDARHPTLMRLPYSVWGGLVTIAVGGSAIYGASLSLLFPRWRPDTGALWLALSAGLGWCVFGPLLVLTTHCNAFTCAHACLVTMAYGEAVLVSGALVNLLQATTPLRRLINPLVFNCSTVGLSNVVMAGVLTIQLRELGVPAWKTLLLWMLALNGSGAGFFWLFQRLLQQDI